MAEDKRGRRTRHLSLVARAAVAIGAMVWIFHDTDWEELRHAFQRPGFLGYFTVALVTYVAAQLVIAVRWRVLLLIQSIEIPILTVFRLHFVGLFYNNVMPSSVGGDVLKAWYVAKHTHRRWEGVLSVLVDRVVGLSGMLLMAIAAYVLFVRGQNLEARAGEAGGSGQMAAQYGWVVLWAVALLAAVGVAAMAHPQWRVWVRELSARLWQRGRSLLGRTKEALVVYCSKPLKMLAALALTVLGQSMVITAFWLLGRNLGISAGLRDYFVIFPVTWVLGAVPVSIAGLGVLEAGIIELFKLVTATNEAGAKALALCQRFIWVVSSLPGAAVHLLGGHLPKDFSIDDDSTLS